MVKDYAEIVGFRVLFWCVMLWIKCLVGIFPHPSVVMTGQQAVDKMEGYKLELDQFELMIWTHWYTKKVKQLYHEDAYTGLMADIRKRGE